LNPEISPWPSDLFSWSGAGSGTDPNIVLTFDTEGSETLTATLADCLVKTINIQVIVPEIYQISFVDNNPGEEHDIYGISDPIWYKTNPDPNQPYPVSYTMGKHAKTESRFWDPNDLAFVTKVKVGMHMSGNTFTTDPNVIFKNWPSEIVTNVSSSALQDYVCWLERGSNWAYKVPDGTDSWINMGTVGPHYTYVVYDEPNCAFSNYIWPNIIDAITKGGGIYSIDEPSIASIANERVDGWLDCNCICHLDFQRNFDAAMGRYPPQSDSNGMCCCRALGLNYVLTVLGIGPYTRVYCNEMPEPNWATSRHNCTGTCSTHGTVYRFYDAGFPNRWEGAIRSGDVGAMCYAPGGGPYEDDHDGIADNWPYYWYYSYENPPNSGNYEWRMCTSSCVITGYGVCSAHSSYWGRFGP